MACYLEALEAHNEAHDPKASEKKPVAVSDWMRRMMAARS